MDVPELLNPTDFAIPGFVALVLVELAFVRLTNRDDFEARDTTASLMMGVGNVASDVFFGFIGVGILTGIWTLAEQHLGWQGLGWLGFSWPVFVLCFVLDDLRYYWWHRLAHVSRWFWGSHVVHHSSQHYNLSTALRQSWNGHFTGSVLLKLPLIFMGFHPVVIAFCASLNLVYQFWIHTEHIRRLPAPIEFIFNTPSHHRGHHGSNIRYLDCNFAGTLIIWDRMFGTFVQEDDADPPRYGLVYNIGTFNPIRIAFHEWVSLAKDATQPGLTLLERLKYIFAPPGYSHDGSRKTAAMMKAEQARLEA